MTAGARLDRSRRRRRGAVAVVVALCLIPLIGVMAFAFDGGIMLAARRRSQTVADAAAYSAACQLATNLTTDPTGLDVSGKAKAVALYNAKANGFTNDSTTNTVTVNIPPQSGTHQGLAGYAEVLVTYIQPRIFGAVLGSGSMTLTGRGVARISLSSPASVILLDAGASPALSVVGGSKITSEAFIQVNSSSSTGTQLTGGSNITTTGLHLHGGGTRDNSSTVTTTVDSAVKTGVAALADPLATLAVPNPSALTAQSFTSTYGSKTISPGVYSGGISMGNGMTITMQPGVYYMKGGGFSVGGGVTLTGSGVTIFMDNTSGRGQISIAGGASVTLTPPTTGTYAGLTYFPDRANTKALSMSNGATINLKGTIYAAAGAMSLVGGTSNNYGSQIIVDSMAVSNGTNVKINTTDDAKLGYVATSSTSSTPTILLVE